MLSAKTTLTIKLGERTYEFHCDPLSPLGELHDVLCQMKSFIVEKLNAAHSADQPQKAETPVVEPIVESVVANP